MVILQQCSPVLHLNKCLSRTVGEGNPIIQVSKPYNSTKINASKIRTCNAKQENARRASNYINMLRVLVILRCMQVNSYSCSSIVSGDFSLSASCTRRNLVFLRISITSEFLLNSSPSFCPEVKWLQMKQKLVSCRDMLIEMDP